MTCWVTIGIVVAIAVLVVLTVTQRGREGMMCSDPTCGGAAGGQRGGTIRAMSSYAPAISTPQMTSHIALRTKPTKPPTPPST